MNSKEKYWIERCKQYPNIYKIYVDNDGVYVENTEKYERAFKFNSYGQDFIVELLQYIGINADYI